MRRREQLSPEVLDDLAALDAALSGDPVDHEHRELAMLVSDVRASAPRMSPQLAARLETGMAGGFEGRLRLPTMRPWLLAPAAGGLAAVAIALVVVLGANDAPSPDSLSPRPGMTAKAGEGSTPEALVDEAAPRPAGPIAVAPGGAAGSGAQTSGAPLREAARRAATPPPAAAFDRTLRAPGPRKQERSAVITLEASPDDVEDVADKVIRTTDRFGGIVRSSSIGAGDDLGAQATFDLRIPSARLDAALAALSELGHVTQRMQDQLDITGSFTTVQERLSDARAERHGLQRALARATTAQQVQSLKLRLREATSRVGRLKGDLAALRRRADYSTVSVSVHASDRASEDGGGTWTPGDAAHDAWGLLLLAAGIVLVAAAVAIPIVLLGLLGVAGTRAVRQRKRDGALESA